MKDSHDDPSAKPHVVQNQTEGCFGLATHYVAWTKDLFRLSRPWDPCLSQMILGTKIINKTVLNIAKQSRHSVNIIYRFSYMISHS